MHTDKKLAICCDCVRSLYIKSFVEKIQYDHTDIRKCCICGKEKFNILHRQETLHMLANIIIYNYSILEYDGKDAVCHLPRVVNAGKIFENENVIFIEKLENVYAVLLRELLCEKINLNETKWDIAKNIDYANYLEVFDFHEHFDKPLKHCKAALIRKLEEDLKCQNNYEIYDEYLNLFEKIKIHFPQYKVNGDNNVFFRARVGYHKKGGLAEFDFPTEIVFPYIGDELNSPPNMLATSGRFNREGCAFLYLGNDEHTAISEIKPDVGMLCSVAQFKANEEKSFVDLRYNSVVEIYTETNVVAKNIIESIARLFSEPIPKHNTKKYLVTQFMSDIFRAMGFAGIVYDSSLTTGYNITAFYPKNFSIVERTEKLKNVEKVEYTLSEVLDERYKYDYFEFDDGVDEKKYNT